MTTPIVQQLGFDASGAIAQLAKLNQSLISVDQSMVKLSADAKTFSASGLGRSLANAARGAASRNANAADGEISQQIHYINIQEARDIHAVRVDIDKTRKLVLILCTIAHSWFPSEVTFKT